MEWTYRRFAGVSGVVAAGLALGVGELLAGVFDAVPSPLVAIGNVVVDTVPTAIERWAISVFGTADKAVLAAGTVLIALVIGWFMGVSARSRFWVGIVVIGAFAAAGLTAGWDEPETAVIPLVAATVVAAAAGVGTLWMLLRIASEPSASDPESALADDPARRRFLTVAGVGGAVALGSGMTGRALLASVPEPPPAAIGSLGRVQVGPEHDFGIDGLAPAVVPSDEFYRIDTALAIPRIDPEDWSLRIHGRVDREVEIRYEDLTSASLVQQYVTLACVSNRVGGGLVGNALWTGVPLPEILDRAGVDRNGTQLVGRSIDGWTAGFPTEEAFTRDALLAVGMNGEVLPRRHGFPVRLVVPGLYGYVSATKWLTEIEITGWDEFDAYWVPRGWAKEAPIKTQSRIDVPRRNAAVTGTDVPVAGVAWAPRRGIAVVEVAVDGGPWEEAELSVPLSGDSWVQWRHTISVEPGDHTLTVRATDGDGYTQTVEERPPSPDGATGHHAITFSSR